MDKHTLYMDSLERSWCLTFLLCRSISIGIDTLKLLLLSASMLTGKKAGTFLCHDLVTTVCRSIHLLLLKPLSLIWPPRLLCSKVYCLLTSSRRLVLAQTTAFFTLLSYNLHHVTVPSGNMITTVPSSVAAI